MSSGVNDTLAGRVTERMAAMGSNPFALSKAAGLGQDYVRDLLRGKVREPSGIKLRALAGALGCDIDTLLGQETLADSRSPLARRVQERLRELDLTPITAATRAGLPRDTIRNLFRADSQPRADTLAAIAAALDTTVGYLIGESPATIRDPTAITITQTESGMWFASQGGVTGLLVAARSLEDLCTILPEAVGRAAQ